MYFVWRVVIGDEEWFSYGLKDLARRVSRHKKSIGKAVDKLKAKGMIQTEKRKNKLGIKHTLSNDELYTRMAFIDPMFCNVQSMHELQNDLTKEIERLEDEIVLTKEVNIINKEKDKQIDSIIRQVNDSDIDVLIENMAKRTYANSNKLPDEIIKDAFQAFREEVFGKYE